MTSNSMTGAELIQPIVMRVGSRVRFAEDKQSYTIRAMSERYAICTKPYNPKKTVYYTIVDIVEMIRGPNNLVFNIYDYSKAEDCEQSLRDLVDGKIEISSRHRIPLMFSE